MIAERTIRHLLASAAVVAEREAARDAWVRKTAAALKKAQREMDRGCDEAVGRVSEEEFRRLFKAEQAKVCAFLNPLRGGGGARAAAGNCTGEPTDTARMLRRC